MIFQKVLKGINNLSDVDADEIMNGGGIICNWWRVKNLINPYEMQLQLTEDNVIHHLNNYDRPLPAHHPFASLAKNYGDVTPYISTSAGAIQRSNFLRTNIIYPTFITALRFATNNFRSEGYIFSAYLMTIQKKSVELIQFSEEVRELHIYQQYLPYHHEGEIVAKINIPAVQIEKAEKYDGPTALIDLKQHKLPSPSRTIPNKAYADPKDYTNIKELI